MKRVQILEESVIRQIAAGEVVERPSSVVKELMENSIDAGSKRIILEISKSGKEQIRLSDDGCGMNREDALLSLERHTTSKIVSAQDLFSLSSFGFRGEALPSISSISRFELTTRPQQEPHGFSIKLEGGKIIQQEVCGCPVGTTIQVKDLFFNTPARLKFLKSDATERSKIVRTFEEIAIGNPGIHFEFRSQNERPSPPIELPALKSGSLQGLAESFLQRITEVWGGEFSSENLFPLDVQHPHLAIQGWVSKPPFHHPTKSFQIFYVNHRPIVSKSLSHALYEAFKDCLPIGRHPVAVIFLNLNPAEVDVNVHPAKREVRFQNEQQIYRLLNQEIRLKRTRFSAAPELELHRSSPSPFFPTLPPSLAPPSSPRPPVFSETTVCSRSTALSGAISNPETPSLDTIEPPKQVGPMMREPMTPYTTPELTKPTNPQIFGQFQALYLLIEKEDALVIVDQHAASERILYEKFKKALQTGQSIATQPLLFPLLWEVSLSQAELLKNHLETFEKIGFILEPFGEKTFRILEAPAIVRDLDLKTALQQILNAIENQNESSLITEEILKQSACKGAIKANDYLSPKESQELLEQLAQCDNPHSCPHGRPVTLTLSRQELDKKFRRQ